MSDVIEAAPVAPVPDRLIISGSGGSLLGIHLIGLLLSMITFGIYRFWWRTNVRRYLWSCVSYKDEPFEYTGRGLELFVGFLIAFILILLPLMGVYFLGITLIQSGKFLLGFVIVFGIYLGFFVLYGAAIYRVMFYRISRTRWRGVRGALGGSAWRYAFKFFGLSLLQIVTLGFATPYVSTRLYGYVIGNVWFGSGRFRCDPDWRPLFKYYLVPGIIRMIGALLLIVGAIVMAMSRPKTADPSEPMQLAMVMGSSVYFLGFLVLLISVIAMFWYTAALYRHLASVTEFEGVRFTARVKGGQYALFVIVNWLMIIFTLMIAYPWVQMRVLRFVADALDIHGEPDFERISQNTAETPRFGEGLGEVFL
ncbi:MAG: YjgN family protein [Sphingomonadales bacterium]